ncbi:MAG TPA: sugar phosphate isomerase/epimerase, partial [Terriglobia bacterium]|nr:sugar phosphate isomerase/epimerase [Terriglobia bacterium]
MSENSRRSFIKTGILGVAGAGALGVPAAGVAKAASPQSSAPPFKLGTVTYNLAKDWDIDTIIKNCQATGFEAVELRTTHKHG